MATSWRTQVKTFPWDSYQKQVLEFVKNNTSNIIIGASAGSGKTTLLEGIIGILPTNAKIKIIAFNRHIVQRLQNKGRVPKRVSISTFHSAGLGLLQQHFAGKAVVDEHKTREIVKTIYLQLFNYEKQKNNQSKINQAISQFIPDTPDLPIPYFPETNKVEKLILREYLRYITSLINFSQTTLKPMEKIIDHFGIEFREWENLADKDDEDEVQEAQFKDAQCQYWGQICARIGLEYSEEMAANNAILSFGECLYLCYKWKLNPVAYDYVLIDEAQDLNPCQIELVKSYQKGGARLIFCGDERQAIQGFQGSDAFAWHHIKQAFAAQELPLHISHRCSQKVVELAQNIVPYIEADPNNIEGKIAVVHSDSVINNLQSGDLMICRFNAPLFPWCFAAIHHGYSAKIRGRDIGKNLVSFARQFLNAEKDWPHEWKNNFVDLNKQEIQNLRLDGRESEAEMLEDKYLSIMNCYQEIGISCKTFEQFGHKMLELFNDTDKPQITLSTIHRSKGDEAERVFIISPESLPFLARCSKKWQQLQEYNLLYVAITRALKELYLIPFGKYSKVVVSPSPNLIILDIEPENAFDGLSNPVPTQQKKPDQIVESQTAPKILEGEQLSLFDLIA